MTEQGVVVEDCGSQHVQNFDYNKLKDRKYQGEDYNCDKTLVNGPVEQRKCTDCLFLIVWLSFLVGMMWMTIDGYVNGNGAYMIAPINQNKGVCGFGTLENYPVLYFPDLAAATQNELSFFTYGVCAESCPTSSTSTVTCQPAYTASCTTNLVYETYEIMNYCIPSASALANLSYTSDGDDFTTSNYYLSMYESRWVFVICIFIALILSLVYIKFMDWCAVPVAWGTIICIEIALCVSGYFSYAYAQNLITADDGNRSSFTAGALCTASACWIAAGLFYIVMFCNFKSLKISVAIIETAADFFADTKRIIMVPFGYFSLWVLIFVFWLWGLSGVSSIGTFGDINAQFQSKEVFRSDGTNWMIAGMVLGMVWISAFIMACNEFAIICAAASWYFSRKDIKDSDGIPGDADVTKGIWWTYRYQMGTMAFGSFILTVVWTIKWILEFIGNRLADATAHNPCTECLLCCMKCCLDCFDRFIRFLNANAYIYCAISSESFCPSALHAFLLILKNAAKFSFVESMAGAFMFLAKMFVAITTTMIAYLIIPPMTSPINVDPTTPCVFIFFFSYLVASTFISIFDISALTILQCYLYDLDISKHHQLELNHVPASLLKFLDAHAAERVMIDEAQATNIDKQNLLA